MRDYPARMSTRILRAAFLPPPDFERRCLMLAVLIGSLVLGWASLAPAQSPGNNSLNRAAVGVLRTYCHRCHGVTQKLPDLDILDRHSLTKQRDGQDPIVVPGRPDDSVLWHCTEREKGYMPQSGSPEAERITQAERDLLRRWIAAGAKFPEVKQRPFRNWLDDLQVVREDLLLAAPDDRRHLRYITLSHLHNHPRYDAEQLALVRAAVSKLLNSLSWEERITIPRTVSGSQGALLAIDLRDYGWSNSRHWLQIADRYPYGLKLDYIADQALRTAAADIRQLSGGDVTIVRADWLVFAAARPPLYHDLLGLPRSIADLEARLGVDVQANLSTGEAARAGFGRSGVSRQNRLIERHASKYGAYWLSYDFLPRRGRGDLIRFPLGPKSPTNRFNRHAFEHDGGEAIFHLPNGLQAYYLVDGDGKRLDGPAPAEVVYDSAAIAGTPAIVNGLSCMNCHREGMISGFRDEIRDSGALAGSALQQVRNLYPPHEVMQRLVARDRHQFLAAMRTATAPLLEVGQYRGRDIAELPEPIGRVVERYLQDLGPREVALELGLPDIETIRTAIEHDRDLRKLGMGTLIQDQPGTIQRTRWEAIDGTSFFQDVAVELRLGTPILPGTTLHGLSRAD